MFKPPAGPPKPPAGLSKPPAGSLREIFLAFLILGLTAFGGPVAHLGYFREAFVRRRGWIDEAGYADLVALCQFLPGPASSQVGFALGILRAGGLAGGLAAFAGFTLPSALILGLVAQGAGMASGPLCGGLLHGLKLVAVAVVAQAVWGMARTLAPDRTRAGLVLAALWIAVLAPSALGQVFAIGFGALAGLVLCRGQTVEPVGPFAVPISRRVGIVALALFGTLLVGLPILGGLFAARGLAVFEAFYRAGALVFGGGHVVLPLLRAGLVDPGWVSADAFLAGYGAAQAVPGPLFTVAAYLGAVLGGPLVAALALAAIFLPGLLLVTGALPFWDALRRMPLAQAALRGGNAAVVGLLAAALYDPVWTGAIANARDLALAATAFGLLNVGAVAPWIVVGLTALGGLALTLWG